MDVYITASIRVTTALRRGRFGALVPKLKRLEETAVPSPHGWPCGKASSSHHIRAPNTNHQRTHLNDSTTRTSYLTCIAFAHATPTSWKFGILGEFLFGRAGALV